VNRSPGAAVPGTALEETMSDGDASRRERVTGFLHERGADQIDHLNGTLFDHLERTELLLRRWGCSEVVSIAGLSHAVYGTDGFPTALVALEDRGVFTGVAGSDVEALVYLYACCDRRFVYPRLSDGVRMDFRDRFSGRTFLPAKPDLRDFVDLTLANEFDVGVVGPTAAEPPEWLWTMFNQFQHLASQPLRDGFVSTAGHQLGQQAQRGEWSISRPNATRSRPRYRPAGSAHVRHVSHT
jgi:hypothetical protein